MALYEYVDSPEIAPHRIEGFIDSATLLGELFPETVARDMGVETAENERKTVDLSAERIRETIMELVSDEPVSQAEPGTSLSPKLEDIMPSWFIQKEELPKRNTHISNIKEKIIEIIGGRSHRVRAATPEDIDTLVAVDIQAFGSVYKDYSVDPFSWRDDLRKKFAARLEKVGGWMEVFEKNGEILGFITSCPTSKVPEEFSSWEETTDDGTLETTYDPEGKNIYVVSLSMIHRGSSIKGQNMLFADQIGRFISEGYEQAFFESRLPGLRDWVSVQCEEQGKDIDLLNQVEKDTFAGQYFNLKKTIKGKEVPYDRLLQIYHAVGCKFIKVIPDAYQDNPSMDYGVVCVFDNPLPPVLRKSKIISRAVGGVVRLVSRSPLLSRKLF